MLRHVLLLVSILLLILICNGWKVRRPSQTQVPKHLKRSRVNNANVKRIDYDSVSCDILYAVYTRDHHVYARTIVSLLLEYGAPVECLLVINANRELPFTYRTDQRIQVYSLLTEIDCKGDVCSDYGCTLNILSAGMGRYHVDYITIIEDVYIPSHDIISYYQHARREMMNDKKLGVASAKHPHIISSRGESNTFNRNPEFQPYGWMAQRNLMVEFSQILARKCTYDQRYAAHLQQVMTENFKESFIPDVPRVLNILAVDDWMGSDRLNTELVYYDSNVYKYEPVAISAEDVCYVQYVLDVTDGNWAIARMQIALLLQQRVAQDCIAIYGNEKDDNKLNRLRDMYSNIAIEGTSCYSENNDCLILHCILRGTLDLIEVQKKRGISVLSVYILKDDQIISPDFVQYLRYAQGVMEIDTRIITASAGISFPLEYINTKVVMNQEYIDFPLTQHFPKQPGTGLGMHILMPYDTLIDLTDIFEQEAEKCEYSECQCENLSIESWQYVLMNREESLVSFYHLLASRPRVGSFIDNTFDFTPDLILDYPNQMASSVESFKERILDFADEYCVDKNRLIMCDECVDSITLENGHTLSHKVWNSKLKKIINQQNNNDDNDILELPLFDELLWYYHKTKHIPVLIWSKRSDLLHDHNKKCEMIENEKIKNKLNDENKYNIINMIERIPTMKPTVPVQPLSLRVIPPIWPRPKYDSRLDETIHMDFHAVSIFRLDQILKNVQISFASNSRDQMVENKVSKRVKTMINEFAGDLLDADYGEYIRKIDDIDNPVFDGPMLSSIKIEFIDDVDKIFDAPFGANEEYIITITRKCDYINIEARSTSALARALSTLLHMIIGVETDFNHHNYKYNIDNDNNQYHLNENIIFTIPGVPCVIKDSPNYSYRSFLIDTGRAYLPVPLIKNIIKAMSLLKFNILHWHLMDDQSFPIEIKSFPDLYRKGAYWLGFIHNFDKLNAGAKTPTGTYYTQEEIKILVNYAKIKGVRLIPEVDMPGHSRSWGKAIPELATDCPNERKRMERRVNKPNYLVNLPLNIANEKTYTVASAVIREVAELFDDPFFVLGADEVKRTCWEEAGIRGSLQSFITRIYNDVFLESPLIRKLLFFNFGGHQNNNDDKEDDIEDDDGFRNVMMEKHNNRENDQNKQNMSSKTVIFWERIPSNNIPKDKGIVLMWQNDLQITDPIKKGYRVVRARDYYLDYEYKNNDCCTWWGQYKYYPEMDFENDKHIRNNIIGACTPAWELTPDPSWSWEGPGQKYWYRGFEKVWTRVVSTGENWWSTRENKATTKDSLLVTRMYDETMLLKRHGVKIAKFCHDENMKIEMQKTWCYEV